MIFFLIREYHKADISKITLKNYSHKHKLLKMVTVNYIQTQGILHMETILCF